MGSAVGYILTWFRLQSVLTSGISVKCRKRLFGCAGFPLRRARLSLGRFEQEIVVALGIEWRVEVDEINGLGRDVVAEDVEVVAIVELIHGRRVCAGNEAASILHRTVTLKNLTGGLAVFYVWSQRIN